MQPHLVQSPFSRATSVLAYFKTNIFRAWQRDQDSPVVRTPTGLLYCRLGGKIYLACPIFACMKLRFLAPDSRRGLRLTHSEEGWDMLSHTQFARNFFFRLSFRLTVYTCSLPDPALCGSVHSFRFGLLPLCLLLDSFPFEISLWMRFALCSS